MSSSRYFDTVAFDVRDDTSMLFFAKTTATGDIEDYLLIMRAEGDSEPGSIYLEVNEQQYAGHDLVREARMTGNILTLDLHQPAETLDGATEIVLTFEATADNKTNLEAGAFRVLGDLLAGGNA